MIEESLNWPGHLLSDNGLQFDVQLYLYRNQCNSKLFDMSEHSSLIPGAKAGMSKHDLEEMTIYHRFNSCAALEHKNSVDLSDIAILWGYDNDMSITSPLGHPYKKEFNILFNKIVEIMNIRPTRIIEYQQWFEIKVGKWIQYFGITFDESNRSVQFTKKRKPYIINI
ncbi:hypothetical protein RFI_24159 [Reticulomyxa filosa]|uniref:Uncharacterized protein n=1 Tax=Reticulomyxa filosa TaxID=46433 RepID=X6MJH4_RETFI|nr:hypothetical protein RFI_24159 [Reticulomyxa filosa]|eukprot:ETO13215.1 hypothetical protein RFI_24159 [Reticulomyxa filosa]